MQTPVIKIIFSLWVLLTWVGVLDELSEARIYPKLNREKPKAMSEQILELEVMIPVKIFQAMHR